MENSAQKEVETDTAKRRRCLKCGEDFQSAWAGERVCARCKSSSAWRSGMTPRSHPSSGRR